MSFKRDYLLSSFSKENIILHLFESFILFFILLNLFITNKSLLRKGNILYFSLSGKLSYSTS